MYTFSKKSWHVKLFKWIFNEDPTKLYKSMCPYFWSYVLILIFLPVILVVKMFGVYGTQFLNHLRTYRQKREEKAKQAFLERCQKENLTEQEAYSLVKSKCWGQWSYCLSYERDKEIRNLFYKERDRIYYLNEENKQKRIVQYKEVKESKWFPYISYVITASVAVVFLYLLYYLFSLIEFRPMDWKWIGEKAKVLGFLLGLIGVGFLLFNYIIHPLVGKLKCVECRLCKTPIWSFIGGIFIFIWKGILIVKDMIYVTYKKNCPLIKWEEN